MEEGSRYRNKIAAIAAADRESERVMFVVNVAVEEH